MEDDTFLGQLEYEENQSIFDEKEREKRLKIAEDIKNIGIIEDSDNLFKLSLIQPVFEAFEHRIPLTDDEFKELMETLRITNRHIKDAFAILDSYITFSHETPNSENILNIIYNFNKFIRDEISTPFHQVRFENEKIHYFRYKWFTTYLNNLSTMLERLQGLLERAAKYIVDAENEARQGTGYGYGNNSYGGYGGYGGYNYPYNSPMSLNDYRFAQRHPTNIAKFNQPRDLGDVYDSHEVEKADKGDK